MLIPQDKKKREQELIGRAAVAAWMAAHVGGASAPASIPIPGPSADALLLESGDFLIAENGDYIILE